MIAQAILAGALCLGVAAGVAGVYLQGKRAGKAECVATQALVDQAAERAGEAAARTAAEAIGRIKIQHRTVQQEVQREILERPVYRECVHSAEQLRRINAALTGEPAEPAGGGVLSAAGAAGGSELRRDDDQADRGGRAVPGVP